MVLNFFWENHSMLMILLYYNYYKLWCIKHQTQTNNIHHYIVIYCDRAFLHQILFSKMYCFVWNIFSLKIEKYTWKENIMVLILLFLILMPLLYNMSLEWGQVKIDIKVILICISHMPLSLMKWSYSRE